MTGFEPFPGAPDNPTERLAKDMPRAVASAALHTAVLPVDSARVASALIGLRPESYDAVVHTGVAQSRTAVSLERTAVNWLDFTLPDNAGLTVRGQPILRDGPPSLPARLPLAAMQTAFEEEQVPVEMSDSAGRYLCNQVMYWSLVHLPTPTGFIHVPPDEGLAEKLGHPPVVRYERLRAGLLQSLAVLVQHLNAERSPQV